MSESRGVRRQESEVRPRGGKYFGQHVLPVVRSLAVIAGLALFAGCGSSGSSGGGGGSTTPPPVANSVSVSINGGPANNALNVAYISVRICSAGGTTNCVTVPNVQLDTGSSGLRILASAQGVSGLNLTQVTGSSTPVYECFQYASGNYLWGPVEQAGVAMAGETATNVPIQLIASGSAPSSVSCSSSGNNLNTSTTLQANGILGVGPAVQDCGLLCTTSPVLPYYWLCASSSSCSSPANVPTATQVSNPVAFFGSDNNGVALAMNSVAATGASAATGTLYFGVGTQTDNALGSGVKAYALSSNVFGGQAYTSIKAVYNGVTYPAYVNSAESILFLLDPATVSIASCTSNIFYCPSSPVSLPLTIQDNNGNSAQINPSIGNGATLYDSSLAQGGGPNAAFSNLAGGFVPTNYDEVILGMPFFYGRTVYIGIAGQTPPTGIPTSYAGLGYWAF